ncbi:MAG: tRNA (N(6)-L-threonylcarbamoyladenosine(37)-C(2))-methylthiotransferase MtaB [Alphaproteobacteria bacterium]|nr:tRNA (N(6)-L-threonylcarbamoyladenosine(37)-C(2))-methylthiotransferase MtaB [Alphaproteobacteria bacterium]
MTVKSPQVQTFGCRLNVYESEVMKTHAREAGLEDAVIFNTCAVTEEAERQARQAIRRAKRENPAARVIVTGCSAQIKPDLYAAMPEVERVIGNHEKLKSATWSFESSELGTDQDAKQDSAAPSALDTDTQTIREKIHVNDIMSVRETAGHLLKGFEGHSRAFVQVQNGCDHRCTFCIIPYGRGNSRSVPIEDLIAQVRLLVEQGYGEIVFSGVDITSYGKDLPGEPTLGYMIKLILRAVPDLKRLRLSSLDPVEIDEDLWDVIANDDRLMPHLHLSVQSGDDMILKRMKRRHLSADVINIAQRARSLRPDIVFGADIIAGFPTEDEAMFENTLNHVREADLTFLHVFTYSPRPLTPAAKMPQVPLDLRKERSARLRELGQAQLKKFLPRFVGQDVEVLCESNHIGRTRHFAEVKLPPAPSSDLSPGQIITLNIAGSDGEQLVAA